MNQDKKSIGTEEQIRSEERLIQLYEAELAALEQAQQGWDLNRTGNHAHVLPGMPSCGGDSSTTSAGDDDLWSLFPDDQYRQPLSYQEPVHPDILSLQASLLGFQFTDMKRLDSSEDHNELSYEFRGCFVNDRHLEATLRMVFRRTDESAKADDEEDQLDDLDAACTARILRALCKVNRPWMQAEMKMFYTVSDDDFVETTDFSAWIQQIVSYLEFDTRRNDFLHHHPMIAVQRHDGSKITIQLPLLKPDTPYPGTHTSGQSQDIPTISLNWVWSWNAEVDALQMTESTLPPISGLTAHGLAMLVAVRTCPGALLLILNHPEHLPDSVSLSRRSVSAAESKADAENVDTSQVNAELLSEYELMRLERIKRNQAFLETLGLGQSPTQPTRKRKTG